MIEKEKLEELKRNSELVLELIGEIEFLQEHLMGAREEKSRYLADYKKACDEKHKLEAELKALKNPKEGQL